MVPPPVDTASERGETADAAETETDGESSAEAANYDAASDDPVLDSEDTASERGETAALLLTLGPTRLTS